MRQEGVQLRKSPYSNTGAFGVLELEGGRISYTIDPRIAAKLGVKFAAGNYRWIERALGTSGIKERLEAGESVQVFDLPTSEVEVASVAALMGTGFRLKTPEANWTIVFKQVHGLASLSTGMPKGREQVKEWKRALAEAA